MNPYELRPYVKIDSSGHALVVGEFTVGEVERINKELSSGVQWKEIEDGKLSSYMEEIFNRKRGPVIPLVNPDLSIPEDAACQEASPMSRDSYIPCGQPAVAIIDNGDRRPYYMCGPCAAHNVQNRRAKVVKIKPGAERYILGSSEIRSFDICDAKNDRVVIFGPLGNAEIPYSWELASAAGASFVLKPSRDTNPFYLDVAKRCLRSNRDVVSLRVEVQP